MSNEALEGWRTVELADIANLSMGETLLSKNLTGDGIPVFSANTDDGPWGFTSNNRRRLRRGDIVVGARGSIGFPRRPDFDAFTCTQTTIAVEPDCEIVDSEYLHHALCATDILGIASQQAVPMLTIGSLSPLKVALPPLDEQRRIAEVLRSVDEAIAAAQDAANHARVLQSLLTTDRCFGHGFDMVSLGDILADIRYGTSVKCDASEADGHPVLRIPNVVNGRVEQDDLKYAMVSDADLRRFSLEVGDVVVVRTNGNPAYIGRSALIDDSADRFLFASYLIRMRFDHRRAWSPYVYAALNSLPVREKLLKAATTSAGNYNINTASLKGITIPLPSLEAQRNIGEVIQVATEAAIACENAVESNRCAKAALMSDLLSGRVPVPA